MHLDGHGGMEKWQREGFESFATWSKAKDKAR